LPGDSAAGKANYAVDVMSVFDLIAAPLKNRKEKTYSAPLSAYLFAKETVVLPGGTEARVFPRLTHGGAHLKDPERELGSDVLKRAIAGVAIAVLAWNVLLLCVTFGLAHFHAWPIRETWVAIWSGQTTIPWREMLITNGLLFLVFVPMVVLAARYHVLGTDKVGQDILYQALKSIRTSLVIGTLTTLVLLPLGIAAGTVAGYFKGWVDDLVQYVYTTINSIPGVLLIAAAVLMVQVHVDSNPALFPTSAQRADFRLLMLCAILGMVGWTGLARLLRGETLKLAELEYIQAAHAFGVSNARILTRHILPNVAHIVIISLVLDFSGLVLAEAVLSYVGVGVDPSTISFGTMINAARLEMAREPMVWWALATAFAFMFTLVLAANLFADAVRDGFDPRVRM